jgi:hypothetical protein
MDKDQRNLLGEYGPWVDHLARTPDREYSFLNKRWTGAEELSWPLPYGPVAKAWFLMYSSSRAEG